MFGSERRRQRPIVIRRMHGSSATRTTPLPAGRRVYRCDARLAAAYTSRGVYAPDTGQTASFSQTRRLRLPPFERCQEPGVVLSVYLFLSCIQIVVVGKHPQPLWKTPKTSLPSTVYVNEKWSHRMLAEVEDSAQWMRRQPNPLRLMPEASPCRPQAAHNQSACLSTDRGAVIHMPGGKRPRRIPVAAAG